MFSESVDYAGLFPPAELALAQAYEEYRATLRSAHAWMLGRFIVPFSALAELAALHREPSPIGISVILDADRGSPLWLNDLSDRLGVLADLADRDRALSIGSLEIPVPPLRAARDSYGAVVSQVGALLDRFALRGIPCYVEFPRDQRWPQEMPGAVGSLARSRLRSKIRCGGLVAAAFPSPSEIAAHLQACAEHRVAWKATAGLHHPIAHRAPDTGFEMHGFVNLLAAASFALQGAPFEEIEAVLAERSSTAFSLSATGLDWRGRSSAQGAIERARREGFLSFGSCSVKEPIEDLLALGWLT